MASVRKPCVRGTLLEMDVKPIRMVVGCLSARKNLKMAIGYCFYCSFYCFLTILGGQKSFGGALLPAPQSRIGLMEIC